MPKYTIYSNKEDWRNLYEEYQNLIDSHNINVDIKTVKKSTSYDVQWSILQIFKRRIKEGKKVTKNI